MRNKRHANICNGTRGLYFGMSLYLYTFHTLRIQEDPAGSHYLQLHTL